MNRKTISRRFPFVFFMSIGIVPMSIWIWTTEETLSFSDFDNKLSFSFGQVRFLKLRQRATLS